MLRMLLVVVFAGCLGMTGLADDGTVTQGEIFKGELTEKKTHPLFHPNVGYGECVTELPIKLKGGQKISITATVVGTNRKVAVALLDPTGAVVASKLLALKTVDLIVPEVSTSKTFKIVVMSDQIGDFTVLATGPTNDEIDEMKLEADIRELKTILAKKEAALKALKDKKKRP